MSTSSRLCIFCRHIEPAGQPCPKLHQSFAIPKIATDPSSVSATLSQDDQHLIDSLQQQPSSLCFRCSNYDIRRAFGGTDCGDEVLPGIREAGNVGKGHSGILPLGKLSSLTLAPWCQLCRLIYCLMPCDGLVPDDDLYKLEPFPSYIQKSGRNSLREEYRSEYANLLGLGRSVVYVLNSLRVSLGGRSYYDGNRRGPSIALDPPPAGKGLNNPRPIDRSIDFMMIKRHLEACLRTHDGLCQSVKDQRLLATKVVDICARKAIPMPTDCAYVALSYVWGGVQPDKDSLEARTLPATIEDAITATERLGMQYLWVDALCIDQTPNPTPEQAAAKQSQLKMMDLIYSGARVVLCAVSGTSANSGLPRVSPSRLHSKQVKEVIDNDTLYIVPPHYKLSEEASTWVTRAWTFQENTLATRSLYFTEHQWHFSCRRVSVSESDNLDGPVAIVQSPDMSLSGSLMSLYQPALEHTGTEATPATMFRFYEAMLFNYTARKMTNDADSLNAVLGILSFMEKQLDLPGFIWGLPLRTHPSSLAWMHSFMPTPRRRSDFPSWSWVGWEGVVKYSGGMIVETQKNTYPKVDLEPEVVSVQGRELELKGWVVCLDIFTEPLSEVYIPDANGSVTGFITEGDERHPNTLPTGKYRCLVVRRIHEQPHRVGRGKQSIFMIALDPVVTGLSQRKTMLKLNVRADFMRLTPAWETITLV